MLFHENPFLEFTRLQVGRRADRRATGRMAGLALVAAAFLLVSAPLVASAATTIVRTDDLLATPGAGGWWFAEDDPSSGNATGSMVAGPGTAPLGNGSARMQLDSSTAGRLLLGDVDFDGTRLDALTTLTYSALRSSADAGNLLAI